MVGKTVTISFYAKADSAKDIAAEFYQNFGSGGSTGVPTFIDKFSLTTSWQKFTATVVIPTISGTTIGAGDHLAFQFWFEAGSTFDSRTDTLGQQSGTFDIAQVQLEVGSVATPF